MWVVMEFMERVLGVGGNGDPRVFILCTAQVGMAYSDVQLYLVTK